ATVKQEDVVIELLGDDHKTVLTSWTLQKAIPIKLALSDFSATGNELAVESVDIACEAIIRG
ncbi:phage tail protein, partial [Desulfovibrio desulfuricans]|uniref:phage tail protein n=2 Tax=Bacteria TaxID=2 RepID=UPI001D0924B5